MTSSTLKILGIGAYLPKLRMASSAAIEAGHYSSAEARKSGFFSVAIEPEKYPAEMAWHAVAAIAPRVEPDRLRWVFYSHIHYQGHLRVWSPASWLQRQLGASSALSLNCMQGCNALLLSLDVASRLVDGDRSASALCVASDRFDISGFRRWQSDYGFVYGDAATAVSIGYGDGGVAEILAIESTGAPELEDLHRHPLPGPEGSFDADDIRATKKAYLQRHGSEVLTRATRANVAALWARVQAKTGVNGAAVRHLLLPHLGEPLLRENYLPALPVPPSAACLDFGSQVGHLGCSDAVMALHALKQNQRARSGDLALLVGAGAGFSWSLCLVRML